MPMKEKQPKSKIAFLASVQTTRGKVQIGVFEDEDDAIQFQYENGEKILIEDINFFPKRRAKQKPKIKKQPAEQPKNRLQDIPSRESISEG